MTQENKELLLKDLCARLSYGVKVEVNFTEGKKVRDLSGYADIINQDICVGCSWMPISDNIKPYLRPMSSMTEEEKQMMDNLWKDNNKLVFADPDEVRRYRFYDISVVDFLNSHHFDYRGLIPMSLALEAPKGMYDVKKK